MFPARAPLALFSTACVVLVALTSCTAPRGEHPPSVHHPPAGVAEETAAALPAATTAPSAPARPVAPPPAPAHAAPVDPVAQLVVARLASQLLVPADAVEVVAIQSREWPDGCLGLPAEGEICAMAITPGYAVTLSVGADSYEFRTDLLGERIRVASAPPARTGDPLVTWSDAQSFNMMIVGTQRVAIGRRGRPLIASPLAIPARATELQEFLAEFAPFQARTSAGEIALRGVGTRRASTTDQRMIAEWARLVSLEARAGGEQPEAEVALRWTQRGGAAGVCDVIAVSRTGVATATSCRGATPLVIATLVLDPEELDALYGWLDRFEAFTYEAPPPAPGAGDIRLDFRGSGVDEATADDDAAVLAWVERLAVRLRAVALRQ